MSNHYGNPPIYTKTGGRDLSAEQRAMLRKLQQERRQSRIATASTIFAIIFLIAAFWLFGNQGPVCTGSQVVYPRQGQGLYSLIDNNVDGMKEVNTEAVAFMVRERDSSVENLQLGQAVKLPERCSTSFRGMSWKK